MVTFSPETEKARFPDAKLGDAYEATSPQARAWIKNSLSLVQSAYGRLPTRCEVRQENQAFGYTFCRRTETAPWVTLLLGNNDFSAVRLAAAIMTARLAGVEEVFAVWTGAQDTLAPTQISALELTGVEHVFALPADRVPTFLDEIRSNFPGTRAGRVLVFGYGNDTTSTVHSPATICPEVQQHAIWPEPIWPEPTWQDTPPLLGIFPDALPVRDLIAATHPDATIEIPTPDSLSAVRLYTAVYGTSAGTSSGSLPGQNAVQTRLRLSSDLAGAWLCPDLAPDFFLNSEISLSTLP